ncbi:MAG: hypothetical protein A2Z18_01955 [Armatimonadetes bacterium RBG_16_58_9]|nr:MAG: hypothetical protein A2Z18_01955 [Armatimonadetes bacterium RBG_16_58_9]
MLKANYTPLVEGEDTIAGRQVWTMRLKPKRKNFAWKQLWIDKQTYVVLASKDWSFQNEMIRTMVTTHVSYCDRPLAKRRVPKPDGLRQQLRNCEYRPRCFGSSEITHCPSISQHVAAEAAERYYSQRVSSYGLRAGRRVPPGTIQPRYIPTGFVLDRVEVDKDCGSAQLVYSDGLYAISVFVGGIAGKSVERLCPGTVYDWGQGLMVATRVRDEDVLVMGDLPAEEIEKIAGSVR